MRQAETEKTKDSWSPCWRISDCLWLCPQLSLDIPYWVDAESGSWYEERDSTEGDKLRCSVLCNILLLMLLLLLLS